eukprot:2461763-Prymnesium_polylepis.1
MGRGRPQGVDSSRVDSFFESTCTCLMWEGRLPTLPSSTPPPLAPPARSPQPSRESACTAVPAQYAARISATRAQRA